jgi:4'-phosphopantetheinyl transferase
MEQRMDAVDSASLWIPAPAGLALSPDHVHVWRAILDRPAEAIAYFQQTLSADERARADRYRFDRDRLHFIAARGILRMILARYLLTPADQLQFLYNPYGKPGLSAEGDQDPIHFNISHSQGLALYAFTLGRRIGIDVEYIRQDVPVEDIAERFFSASEATALRAVSVEERHQAFTACWTRKEAYIKGQGLGLSIPLDQFDVALTPGAPAALLSTRHNPPEARRWHLADLPAGPGYAAAVAVEGHHWQLHCWQWPG